MFIFHKEMLHIETYVTANCASAMWALPTQFILTYLILVGAVSSDVW